MYLSLLLLTYLLQVTHSSLFSYTPQSQEVEGPHLRVQSGLFGIDQF